MGVAAPEYLFVANRREQLFAFETLCTDTKRGLFFWGLDGAASRCNRRFYATTADGRTRKFRRAPCDPRAECDAVYTQRWCRVEWTSHFEIDGDKRISRHLF